MTYIIKTVINMIIDNLPSKNNEMMVKVDGFEDIRIYEKICQNISKELSLKGLSSNIKLAKSKWNYFNKNDVNTSFLQSMEQNGWVATEESITYYRNLHDSKVLLLLGTEDEEDKGGLLNFYSINPDVIIKYLDGDYSQIFGCDFDDNEKQCINKLYKDLFEFIPLDICKLCSLADSWKNQITTIDDFISKFYETLPEWGLPVRRDVLPNQKQINGKKNLLKPEYNFISRQMFKALSKSTYNKFRKKIEKYINDEGTYLNDWEGWSLAPVKSFEEFEDVLLQFIRGEDIQKNKEILLSVDYSVVEAVLDIRIPVEERVAKDKTNNIAGEPLEAFTRAIMYMLFTVKSFEDEITVKKLHIEFNQAEIVSMFSDTINDDGDSQSEQLEQTWRNICRHTNGVFEYIKRASWTINENDIEIESPIDFFSLDKIKSNINEGKVIAANSNKVISKIDFKIEAHDENDNPIKLERKYLQEKFIWKFSYNSSWLNNFSDICLIDSITEKEHSFIPLGTSGKAISLLFAKSEEEFFDVYNESDINLEFNLVDYIDKHINNKESLYLAKFSSLGNKFTNFILSVYREGFYKCICDNNQVLKELIDEYIELGKLMSTASLQENEKWLLDVFIYAFSLVENHNVLETDSRCAIVPPWHPATLEKTNDQKVFFLDGCSRWWNENENLTRKQIDDNINGLIHMSMIQSTLDIFPTTNRQYYGIYSAFGSFSAYGRNDIRNDTRLKDIIHKDAIYDDDFTGKDNVEMNDNAKMIYGILHDYQKAFPSSYKNISLAFIDPSELQPIVASIYKFIEISRENHPNAKINIVLRILVKPDNKGGKNYLAYWMDECFAQDDNINVKTYMNEWSTKSDIDRLLNGNNDIVFVMDFLKLTSFNFAKNKSTANIRLNECRFPIVYKPSPVSRTSLNIKRKIEISQPQFKTAFVHTQVVRYKNNSEIIPECSFIAVREVSIDESARKLVETLHEKAYWVVCLDSGMDGALLKNESGENKYPIIGFSTGKGSYGQYNLTVTSRESILKIIKKKLERRLYQLFHWDKEKIEKAAEICLREAASLDGISLLSAINQKDHNINEFMAYVLTSLLEKESIKDSALKIVVHLDSYMHWFDNHLVENESNSRPDFLILNVSTEDASDKLIIDATVVECKTSTLQYSLARKEKAIDQVIHGIKRLKQIFDPDSVSMKRRYWYAQLYRALAFAQITFSDNSDGFSDLSEKLRLIFEGNFRINWNGKVIGYWLDKDGEEIEISNSNLYDNVQYLDIPQLKIQKLLLQNNSFENNFVNQDFVYYDDNVEEENIRLREEEIDEEMKNIYHVRKNKEYVSASDDIGVEIQENPVSTDEKSEKNIEVPVEIDNNFLKTQFIEQTSTLKGNLEDIRVLVGKNKMGEDIFWEFGNKELPNRHLLITGTSGQGKTYSIQTMLYELSKSSISSIIFDYTEGFRLDQLEKEFTSRMSNKIHQRIVKFDGVPINPFQQHEIDVLGEVRTEFAADVASRFANILSHVYKFGEQQSSAIFEATRIGIEKYKSEMNMDCFRKELELLKNENRAAQTVLSKMTPFFYSVKFDESSNFDWNDVLYSNDAQTTIFQLTNIDRETQIIITELMLWDMWYYTKKYGNKNKPFVVVLDEAQNLSHKSNSPSAMILTEGRKFGWSAWFATQSLKILSDDEIIRLLQAPFKLYFKPTDEEIPKMAKQLDPANGNIWLAPLKNLKKGQCIVVGDRVRADGTFGQVKSTITSVTAFKERG